MQWHFIEGKPGCEYAVAHGCVAVIVDALRASATAAMMCAKGARELLVVQHVHEARAAAEQRPGALLYGEREGLPPEGFAGGNSPLDIDAVKGQDVIFTTTTGAGRLVSAWGAAAVLMGTTINGAAAVRAAARHERDVVLIPAGLTRHPEFDAQEDRAAAADLLMRALELGLASNRHIGEGRAVFEQYRGRVVSEGLDRLFATAAHAEKLRRIGHDADIAFCAQRDVINAVPVGIRRDELGVLVRSLGAHAVSAPEGPATEGNPAPLG